MVHEVCASITTDLMSQSRNWCFTINNPTEKDELDMDSISKTCRYMVVGKEVGDSGTPHAQGFVIFTSNYRLNAVKALLPRAHLEAAKGSWEQAANYCKKDGDYLEFGTAPATQKRKGEAEKERWDAAREAAKKGKLDEVDSDIYLRYYRTLKEIAKDHMEVPANLEDSGEMLWYYGASGTGKSRKAREENPDAYLKMCNKWWDGYQGQDVVLIEDLDKKHDVLGHHLKIWGDRYSFLAETKGGAIAIRPKKIIVTSNYSIEEIWFDEETREPLKRRFKQIKFHCL